MSEAIWFPLYPERFMASRKVRRMDAQAIGIYLCLLMEEWMEGGALPDDDAELELAGRAPPEAVRSVLGQVFTITEDGWINETLETIRDEQLKKHAVASRAGKAGAEARWGKRKPKKPQAQNGNRMGTLCDPICGANGKENEIESEIEIEKEKEKTESAVPPLVVENSEPRAWTWGDFAGWFRTTGHKILWQGNTPPEWANKDRPWTIERDLSVLKALVKKGERLEALKGVIELNREPTVMAHFNQAGRWDYYYRAKAEWMKREAQKENQIGAIMRKLAS